MTKKRKKGAKPIFNDMHPNLVWLTGSAMTGYGWISATLHKKGWRAAINELGSILTNADKNLAFGAIAALAVGFYWMIYSYKFGKSVVDKEMFSKENMKAALLAMIGTLGSSFFNDYLARISYELVMPKDSHDSLGEDNDSYGTAVFLNLVLTTVFNAIMFHLLTSGFFGCAKALRANFADDKIVAFLYGWGAGGGMSGILSYDYFKISLEKYEGIFVHGLLGGLGATAVSGLVVGLYKCFTCSCSEEEDSAKKSERKPLLVNDQANQQADSEEDDEDEEAGSCLADLCTRTKYASGTLWRKK